MDSKFSDIDQIDESKQYDLDDINDDTEEVLSPIEYTKRKFNKRTGKPTQPYKKFLKAQIEANDGKYYNDIPDLVYDLSSKTFKKRRSIVDNRKYGVLKSKYIKQGYQFTENGHIVKILQKPKKEYAIWGVFQFVVRVETEKGLFADEEREMRGQTHIVQLTINDEIENELAKERYIIEEIARLVEYLEDSDVVVIKSKVKGVWIENTDTVDVFEQPMFGASTVPLSYLHSNILHDEDTTGDCVPRTLFKLYQKYNNGRDTNITMNDILSILNNKPFDRKQFINPLDDGLDDSPSDEELKKILTKGYNTNDIIRFCAHYRIRMYALDLTLNAFYSNKSSVERNHNLNSLFYVSTNNHMYLINDKQQKEAITKTNASNIKMKHCEKKSAKLSKTKAKKEILEEDQKYVITDHIPTKAEMAEYKDKTVFINHEQNIVHDFFYEEIRKGRIHDSSISICSHSGSITSFGYCGDNQKCLLVYNNDIYQLEHIIKKLNCSLKKSEKPYCIHSANLPYIGLEYFERNYGHNLSQLSPSGYDMLERIPENTSFNEFWSKPKSTCDIHGYDICKQYTSVLYNECKSFPVFLSVDEVLPYDGHHPLANDGFYFVKSANYFPLKGDGVYCGEALNIYLEDGIITPHDITYQYIPSEHLSGDHFKRFIDDVYDKFTYDDATSQREKYMTCKKVLNSFIGILRKTNSTKCKHYFTNNFQELCNIYLDSKFQGVSINPIESNVNDDTEQTVVCYHAYNSKKYKLQYTNLPIHRKVYDMATLQIYQLTKKVGLKHCIGVWTDSVYFNGGERLPITAKHETDFGCIKSVSVPLEQIEQNFKKKNPRSLEFVCDIPDWEPIVYKEDLDIFDTLKGCMVVGKGGTGKSYIIKRIIDMIVNCRLCASTNAAAVNIGGETLHKLLGIDPISNTYSYQTVKGLYDEGVRTIIIDEISMISHKIWGLLANIKQQFGFRFFGFGDWFQLPPVMEDELYERYKHSQLLRFIFDSNRIELTKIYRTDDPILYEQLDKVRNGKKLNPSLFGQKICDYALAWTNKVVAKHNYIVNQKYKTADSLVLKKGNCEMYIYDGLPVISTVNKQLYVNNEWFKVVRIENNMIHIKSVRNNVITIDIETFLKDFRIAYALTVHKAQGMTFDFEYTIYEYDRMTDRMLYTAVSRSKHSSLVHLNKDSSNLYASKGYIYMFINTKNNKRYIGSTIDYEERVKQHYSSNANDKFHTALRQDKKAFIHKIIHTIPCDDIHELRRAESYLMEKYNTITYGYNTDNILSQ